MSYNTFIYSIVGNLLIKRETNNTWLYRNKEALSITAEALAEKGVERVQVRIETRRVIVEATKEEIVNFSPLGPRLSKDQKGEYTEYKWDYPVKLWLTKVGKPDWYAEDIKKLKHR